jgi:hypothetical protein
MHDLTTLLVSREKLPALPSLPPDNYTPCQTAVNHNQLKIGPPVPKISLSHKRITTIATLVAPPWENLELEFSFSRLMIAQVNLEQ